MVDTVERTPTTAMTPQRRAAAAVLAVALAVVATVALVVSTSSPAPKAPVAVAPISGPGLNGGTVTAPFGPSSNHATTTVLIFFASWCTPCQRELPMLTRFLRTNARRDVAVVGVDGEAPSTSARAFAAREGIAFPVLSDPPPFAVASGRFGLPGFPDTLVVSADGHLVATHVGEITEAQFAALYRPR